MVFIVKPCKYNFHSLNKRRILPSLFTKQPIQRIDLPNAVVRGVRGEVHGQQIFGVMAADRFEWCKLTLQNLFSSAEFLRLLRLALRLRLSSIPKILRFLNDFLCGGNSGFINALAAFSLYLQILLLY
jgi:hypothetical protein